MTNRLLVLLCVGALTTGCKKQRRDEKSGGAGASSKRPTPTKRPSPWMRTLRIEGHDEKWHPTKFDFSISLRNTGHKHGAGGRSVAYFELRVRRGKKIVTIPYSFGTGSVFWYFEGIAFGHLLTVEPVLTMAEQRAGYDAQSPERIQRNYHLRRITIRPTAKRKLADEALNARREKRAREELKKRGCPALVRGGGWGGFEAVEGDAVRCDLLLGDYSGRVFFRRRAKTTGVPPARNKPTR